jgi:FkbM family methyltransferase
VNEPDSSKYWLRRLRKRLRIPLPRQLRCESVMDIRVEYDPRSAIGQQLYVRGLFESAEIEFCNGLLARMPSPSIIDIGANIGIHSLCWAVSNPTARCDVFEPSPGTAKILRRNIERNGVADRVHVHQTALSNAAGEATFFECSDTAFSSLKDTGRMPVVAQTKVPVTTLDLWAQGRELARVDLVKIDVEGFEHEVIQGAAQVLRRFRPHLFVEIFGGERSNQNPQSTIETIISYGYDAFVFDRQQGLQPYRGHSDRNYNYYFSSASTPEPVRG